MATRKEYNQCMIPYISGQGRSQEERRMSFCVGAKLCSQKTDNEEEAKRLCAEAAANPKPPKKKRATKVCTLKDLEAITTCVIENINVDSLTPENMTKVFGDALRKCSGANPAVATPEVTTLLTAAGKYGL